MHDETKAEEDSDNKLARLRKTQEHGERFVSAVKANVTMKSGGYDHLEGLDFEEAHEKVSKEYEKKQANGDSIIVFGGGCFWCTEAVFQMLRGVTKTTPGYAGGATDNPTYEEVAYEGNPGKQTEVVRVEYDANIISLEKLLEVFFKMHDPTSQDFQGIADFGVAYRSLILYTTEEQKRVIDRFVERQKNRYDRPLVTVVMKLDKFNAAEAYHKDYYKKHPLEPYCIFVSRPKVNKIKKEFAADLK